MPAQGNALGLDPKNISSPEGAKESGTVALGEMSEGRVGQDGPPSRGEFTYVDISSIDRETKRIVEPKALPVAKAPSRAKQVLKTGDVLVSMTRPNLNAVALVPPDLDGAIGSTGFHVLRAKDADPGFLFYAVQTSGFIDAMCLKVQGALYPAVRPKDISSFCIHPFSLAQQRRIVAEIEQQFTRLEAGVAALRRVQANLKRYRAAVLKAACAGQLVPTEADLARARARTARGHPEGVREISRGSSAANTPGAMSPRKIHPGGVAEDAGNSGTPPGCNREGDAVPGVFAALDPRLISASPPGFETGEQLLQRILAERRQHWEASNRKSKTGNRNYVEPAAPDTANLPPLPAGWTWASIDQLAEETMIGLDRGRAQQSYDPASGVPYIKMNNVTMEGRVLYDDMAYVPANGEESERFAVQAGDILFNTRNSTELVGKVGIIRNAPDGAIYNNNLMRIRVPRGVAPEFLCSQMCSHGFRQRMELVKKATTSVAAVYQKDLLPLAIALPPLAEQTRIVAEVERRLSVVEELEAVVSANLQRATRLRQSILQKAFTGCLT